DGDSAPVFPRTLFVGGANSKATLVEVFETLDDSSAALIIGVADVIAKDGAKLDYLCVQDLNTSSKQVHLGTNCAHKDATINAGFVNVGGAWVRNESINRMMDTGSHTEVYAANLATGIQEFDQRTLQIHEAQHTTSNLLFKNALYDKSRCIFGGLIQVREGAHHTDSYQTCRNLLGSDDAEANAMPGLEIGADQVKCSHGSTSGQISDEEIFYLQARGIPADEARQMISFGFLNETLDAISCDDLQEWAANRIAQKFARI
ncbi:MAG: SufD family Fe-S cluster assembly protein, partial [Verrucomicrobiota bacterium]